MRFYGMAYKEVMALPIRAFWSLNANINRLRAEEHLSQVDLFLLGGMGASQEMVSQIREGLNKQMGETAKTRSKPTDDLKTTKEGIGKLRNLKARMRN